MAGMVTNEALRESYAEHISHLMGGYAEALETAGWPGVVIHSGGPKRRTSFDDQDFPLRVTPHFQHWLPLARPDCALLVIPGQRPTLYHLVADGFWEKPAVPETDHFWDAFDVVEVGEVARIKALLPVERLAFVGEDAARAWLWGLGPEQQNPPALVQELDRLRTRKSRYEIHCLAEANRRAALGHEAVRRAFLEDCQSELDLHLLFLRTTGQDDSDTPYKNIVALGANARTLHHVAYGRTPSTSATSLLLDAGLVYQGYCSDITRTYVKGTGAAADTFRALIAGLERLQQEMCRRVVVGTPFEDLHDQSHALLATVLRELEIAVGDRDALVGEGITRGFFPHGLGHSLGLQAHDVGCAPKKPRPENRFLRNTSTVACGQVLTIEPGCYFIDEKLGELRAGSGTSRVNWPLVEELRRFGGVRIEDNLAVAAGEAGASRNLTREVLPR